MMAMLFKYLRLVWSGRPGILSCMSSVSSICLMGCLELLSGIRRPRSTRSVQTAIRRIRIWTRRAMRRRKVYRLG